MCDKCKNKIYSDCNNCTEKKYSHKQERSINCRWRKYHDDPSWEKRVKQDEDIIKFLSTTNDITDDNDILDDPIVGIRPDACGCSNDLEVCFAQCDLGSTIDERAQCKLGCSFGYSLCIKNCRK